MNDTHGVSGEGWYGFDLDGTLAVYDKWQGIDHIGEPIAPMVDLIKKMHGDGKVVKILTARVAPRPNPETKPNPYLTDQDVYRTVGKENEEKYRAIYRSPNWGAREFIADWCLRNIGFLPEITHEKDHMMIELYDDRVKQVIQNDGTLIEDVVKKQHYEFIECKNIISNYMAENLRLNRKLDCKINGFFSGLMLGSAMACLIIVLINAIGLSNSLTEAEKNLDRAIHAYIEAKTEVKL